MRRLTLNLAVPNAWPGKTELDIALALVYSLSRVSFLFPSLESLRVSTSTVLCDSTAFIPRTPTTTTPLDHNLYSMALTSFGSKALVPPLASLTNLEARAIPKLLLLTFASQWTCRVKERNTQVYLRPNGWVHEGEEGEYDEWASFSIDLAQRAEVARENDTEMNWDRGFYRRGLMTGKTDEELAQVHIKVTIKE